MFRLILIFLVVVICVLLVKYYLQNYYFNYYQGSASDHFDGRVFHNYGDDHTRGFLDFIKWRMTTVRSEWPAQMEIKSQAVPPAVVAGDNIRITMIGHATLLIQTQGLNFITDPVFSDRASPFSFMGPKRVRKMGISFENLPKIDVVLLSHNHYDHMDRVALRMLAERDNPLVITPLGNDTILKNEGIKAHIITLDWYQEHILHNVGIVLTPAVHWSSRWSFDKNRALWGGFVIKNKSGNIYFAGDTGYGDGSVFKEIRRRVGDIKVAILPIGAYEPRWFMKVVHLNPEDAVRVLLDLGSPQTIGMHFGSFQLTDEAIDAPEKDLYAALEKLAPDDKNKVKPLHPGEVLELSGS